MKVAELDSWARTHFHYFLDAVRIYLGIGLIIKGIAFLTHPDSLASLSGSALSGYSGVVPWLHIIGGSLLAAGIFPRVGALMNIPVLLAALTAVHTPQIHTLLGREGFEFSALVLFLLCVIAVRGSGPLSLMRMWRRTPITHGPHSFQHWTDEHPDVFADLIRIYLGVGLFVKGMYIMDHRDEILGMVGGANFSFPMVAAAHYVIPAHFVGGAMLILGVLTRWAAGAQIPALFGALLYMFLPRFSILEMRQSVEFTALVLFLLILLTIFGSGRLTIERFSRKEGVLTPGLQPIH